MCSYLSPLRYPGGKSRAALQLADNFPDFQEYREPFFGGGSVFFQAKKTSHKEIFWVNDLNSRLISFWVTARDSIDELLYEVIRLRNQYTNDGKSLYMHLKNEYETDSVVRTAVRYFILNRITFSGLTDSGGYSNEAFQKRFTDSSLEKLRGVSDMLKNVRITNLDYSELLFQDGDDVFLFLDPPYYSQRESKLYGTNGDLHIDFNHELFATLVAKCKHKWMITYDDHPFIRELYEDFFITNSSLQYGLIQKNGRSKRGHELMITNYDTSLSSLSLFN